VEFNYFIFFSISPLLVDIFNGIPKKFYNNAQLLQLVRNVKMNLPLILNYHFAKYQALT